jgi:hypothetical protein
VHNWLNLGTQRAKVGSGGTMSEMERRCPYCNQLEDFTHTLTCTEARALTSRYHAMIPLQKLLSGSGSSGSVLIKAIKDWTLDSSANPGPRELCNIALPGPDFSEERALSRQSQIGWVNFFRGFLT